MPESRIFLLIPATAADAAAFNSNGIKTLLANGWNTFFINAKSTFIKNSRGLPWNPPGSIILNIWVFDNFVLTDRLFAKALQRFASCVLVSNGVSGKSGPSFGITDHIWWQS